MTDFTTTVKVSKEVSITKDDFASYVDVQRRGEWNMFHPNARACTGLSKEVYHAIMEHYQELEEKYPDVSMNPEENIRKAMKKA